MRLSLKPVRKCHSCELNLGDHCWVYGHPRACWSGRKKCPVFEDEAMYAKFREWQKEPFIRTAKDIRREAFRSGRRDAKFLRGYKKHGGRV